MSAARAATKFSHPKIAIIRKLHTLAAKTHIFEHRVAFVKLAYSHGLVRGIVDYTFWDAGFEGLGERQLDDCFEMGDAEEVAIELIKDARANGYVENVRSHFGDEAFNRYSARVDRQASLF